MFKNIKHKSRHQHHLKVTKVLIKSQHKLKIQLKEWDLPCLHHFLKWIFVEVDMAWGIVVETWVVALKLLWVVSKIVTLVLLEVESEGAVCRRGILSVWESSAAASDACVTKGKWKDEAIAGQCPNTPRVCLMQNSLQRQMMDYHQ